MRSTPEVAARWAAHNEQRAFGTRKPRAQGRYGNASYEGRKLYSYSANIATYLEGMGSSYVVFTPKHWSLTTNRHVKDAMFCVGVPKFVVPCLGNSEDEIKTNVEYLTNELREYQTNAIEKWSSWRYGDVNVEHALLQLWLTLENYCKLTGGEHHHLESLAEVQAFVDEERQRRKDIFYNPKSVAKRERARARRIANEVFTRE
jgi:hypothetical protein